MSAQWISEAFGVVQSNMSVRAASPIRYCLREARSGSRLEEILSIAALSHQLPLRLLLQTGCPGRRTDTGSLRWYMGSPDRRTGAAGSSPGAPPRPAFPQSKHGMPNIACAPHGNQNRCLIPAMTENCDSPGGGATLGEAEVAARARVPLLSMCSPVTYSAVRLDSE